MSYTDFDPFTPERDPDEKLKKREERFLFFRFTAQSKAGPLDNTMLCVDTYTKFCWYYAEPGWLQDILGNKVPKDWVDFEDPVIPTAKEVEHTKAYGKFYYYDPVGYVQEDGSVVLYEWAKNDLEAGYFNPRQNYKETATRTPEGAGKSPYFIHDAKENTTPEVSVPRHDAGLLVQMSYIKNESFTSLKQAVLSKNRHELSYVYLFAKTTNSISRDSIVFPNNKNTLECKKIALNETVGITANNSFLLKLSDLRAKGGFELKTETAFANELHKPLGGLIQGSKVGNELNRSAYGIASFTFVPAQGTEPARLRFNGIKNETYRKNDFSTEITASIEKDTYLPLNKSITLTLTYTVNGDIGASTLDKREAPVENARFSVTYTLDFTDGK